MAYNDKQTNKNKHFFQSFRHALAGLKVAVCEERNLVFHLLLGAGALVIGFLLALEPWEWVLLILVIGLVIILELLNTLIENLVDLVTDGAYHPLAKKAKDIAAGMVLVASVIAVIIGLILFLPKINI